MRNGTLVTLCLILGLGWAGGVFADSPEVEQALALKKAGKTQQAITVLEQALTATPQDARAHSVLAWLYRDQGDQAQAVEHFWKVIELAPDSPDAQAARDALQRMGVPVTESLLIACLENISPPSPPEPGQRRSPFPCEWGKGRGWGFSSGRAAPVHENSLATGNGITPGGILEKLPKVLEDRV